MKPIFTNLSQVITKSATHSGKFLRSRMVVLLAILLSFGLSSSVFAQCSFSLTPVTPTWNGNVVCSGYSVPSAINAPSYALSGGGCLSETTISYVWEERTIVNGGTPSAWTTVLAENNVFTIQNLTPGVSGSSSLLTYLPAGAPGTKVFQYRIHVTDDANNLTSTASGFNISIRSYLDLSSVITGTCASTGAINITVTGAFTPYTFAWTGAGVNATAEDQTGLAAGSYQVVVSDAVGADRCPDLTVPFTISAEAVAPTITGTLNNLNVSGCAAGDAPAAATTVSELEGMGLAISDNSTPDNDLSVAYVDASSGTCPIVVTRTYTVTDACGNSSTMAQTLQVIDVTAPSIGTNTFPVGNTTGTCLAGVPAATDDATIASLYTDNCSAVSASHTTGTTGDDCAGWTVTYTYSIVDVCGNEVTPKPTIVYSGKDEQAPSIGSNTSPVGNASGTCLAGVTAATDDATIAALYTDNCSTVSVSHTTATTGDNCAGWTRTYTYSIVDACGNEVTPKPTIVYTGQDLQAPTLITPGSFPVGNATGSCVANVTAATADATIAALYTDNCSTVSASHTTTTTGDNCAGWSVTYTYSIVDVCGNEVTPKPTIVYTGKDITAPVITCPAPVTINCQDSQDPLVNMALGTATAADACDAAPVITYSDAPNQVYRSTDPTPSYDIQGRARNGATGFEGVLFTPGNPSPTGVTMNPAGTPAWSYGNYHNVEFNYTAATGTTEWKIDFNRDGDYLDAQEMTTSVSPTLVGKGLKYVGFFMSGNASVNIDVQNLTINGTNIGSFLSPALGALDQYYQHSSGMFTNITATASIRLSGGSGQETPRLWIRAGVPLNVPPPPPPTCPQNYTINRVWKATDACGNQSSCVQNINVQDVTAPTINGTLNTLSASGCAAAAAPAPAIDVAGLQAMGLTSVTDNCSSVFTVSSTDASAGTCPIVVTRTYTVKDECHNSSTVSQTINVNDVTPPVLITPGTLPPDVTGINACSAPVGPSANDIKALYSDDCGGVVTVAKSGTPTTGCTWSVTYSYEIKDQCNNAVTVNISYSGGDQSPPTITGTLLPLAVSGCSAPAAANNVASLLALGGLTSVSDNCTADNDLTVTHVDNVSGSCPIVVTRTYTVMDACLNASTINQTITVTDATPPVITCPANVTVNQHDDKDPYATGYATATTSGCTGSVTITYADNRDNLNLCNATGYILRTWIAKNSCNVSSICVQTITVQDVDNPVITCPADITQANDLNACGAVVNFSPTALDFGHFQGFENLAWVSGVGSVDWNSNVNRVTSGTDGITSKTGSAHAVINGGSGAFTRLGGFNAIVGAFGAGFIASTDIYIDLTDPTLAANTYGFDLTNAVSNQANDHRRDFAFNVGGDATGVYVRASNNTGGRQAPSFIQTITPHVKITATGWYTFEWEAKNLAGVLAVDLRIKNSSGTVIFTDTKSHPSDLIATLVGGNRYMWFTYNAATKLAIDNTSLQRKVAVTSSPASASTFAVGTTSVTSTATDACGRTSTCNFNVTVADDEDPQITNCPPARTFGGCTTAAISGPSGPAYNTSVTTSSFAEFATTNGGVATDNCGIVSYEYQDNVPAPGSPIVVTRTWILKDALGNTETCDQTLTVYPIVNLNTGNGYATIQGAVAAASANDVIDLCDGIHVLSAPVNITTPITLQGHGRNNTTVEMSSSWFNVNGVNAFDLNAAGTIVKDIHFQVVGATAQGNVIGIFQSNTEIRNNKFSGQYAYGMGEVTRATVWSANPSTGIVMDNNIIESLRQPGYVSNGSGVISNNTFTTTRGWVIEGVGSLSMTGNIWGANTSHITILNTAANISNFTVNNNDLSGAKVDWRIDNRTTQNLNATCNWYGSTSLPVVAPTLNGPITFSPWLTSGMDASGADGFQPSVSCGTPVVISSATATDYICGQASGSVEVIYTGGDAPIDIAWAGPVNGSASNISSPYTISGLTAGSYVVTVTSVNGSTSTANVTVQYLPVSNTTDFPVTYYATIQAAINAADPNEVIEICAGSFTENIDINKALTINGPNDGIAGTGVRGPEAILLNCTIDINNAGNTTLDGLKILRTDNGASAIDQLALDAGGTNTVQNCIFERNGSTTTGLEIRGLTTTTAGGPKVILNNKFTGDASSGVFNNHKTWQRGIYVDAGPFTVNISGNTIENCRTALNVDDYNNNLTIAGNTFDNNGTHLAIGGSVPVTGSHVLGANDFKAPGSAIVNLSNVTTAFRLDITTSTFNGTSFAALPVATLFAIEAAMYHRGRSSRNGLVTYVPNNQYVIALNPSIQSAVSYAPINGVINLDAATFNQTVTLTKSLTLQGGTNDKTLHRLSGTGLLGVNSGIIINNGVTNVTIQHLTVENFTGTNGNSHAGVYGIGGNNNLTISNITTQNNTTASGIYANGPVDNVSITNSSVINNGGDARGIVIWNGLKTNINISNNTVTNNRCCGIELSDGDASAVTVSGNTIDIGNGDNAIGLIGLNSSVGPNVIDDNTITGGGRFGIEIKNPAGGVTVSNNDVTLTTVNSDRRDRAGIAVFRRGVLNNNVDVPNGVTVIGNTVTGYVQNPLYDEGFGIVIEGTNHTVSGNTLNNCNVGIQQQGGAHPNANYPGDGNQGASNQASTSSLNYFGRGNSPFACGNVIDNTNVFSGNGTDTRNVISSNNFGLVTNTNNGETFCNIQSAIDDAQTANSHTLTVAPGTYLVPNSSTILVNKELTLRGANYGSCATGTRTSESKIVVNHSSGFAMTIRSGNVTVDGFEFETQQGRDAINVNTPYVASGLSTMSNFNFSNNIFRSSTTAANKNGIVFGENNLNGNQATPNDQALNANVTIQCNKFDYTSFALTNRGIVMTTHFDMHTYNNFNISNNQFLMGPNGTGIVGTAVPNRHTITNLNVSDNSFAGGLTGLDFTKAVTPTIENNIFGTFTFKAIGIGSSNGGVVRGNTINGASAALLSGGSYFGYGIDLYGGTDFGTPANGPTGDNGLLVVENNEVSNFTHPTETAQNFRAVNIRNNPATGLTIRNNAITNVQNGVLIASAATNVIAVNENSFTTATTAIRNNTANMTVAGTCNWYGTNNANTIATQIAGLVTYSPYLTSGGDGPAIGFQPTGLCDGSPNAIASAVADHIICGETTGSIDVTFSGGTAPYDIVWTGGSANGVTSPHLISGLTAGTYAITVTDANGSTATTSVTVQYLPVTNVSDMPNTYYPTIQAAIDAATTANGEVIEVCAGVYAENITVNKQLDIRGPKYGVAGDDVSRGIGEAVVVPAVNAAGGEIFMVKTSNVSINGFTIDGDNPLLTSGWIGTNGADINAAEGVTIYDASPVVNNLKVSNNIIQNLGYFGVTLFGASNYSDANTSKSGHIISNNLIRNLGYYGTGNGFDRYGGGILLYNSHYAHVTNNVMTNVRIGIQTGNYQTTHIGSAPFGTIEGNSIQARYLGVFYNLHRFSPWTISNNTITGLDNATEAGSATRPWRGMLLGSLGNNMGISNLNGNIIDGSGITSFTTGKEGINIWNVQNNAIANITNGSITGVETGIFLNNYEGYASNAADGAHATISNVSINASKIGVRVFDSPSSTTHAKVTASVTGCTINSAEEGIKTQEAMPGTTSGSFTDNTINAGTVGINITGMALSATNSLTIDDNNIDLSAQTNGGNPTVGISIANVTGTAAATITDNDVTDAFYGYGVYKLNTTPISKIEGGTISGVMQGIAFINVDPITFSVFAPSNAEVNNVSMNTFTGSSLNPANNFHAGVYAFTAATTTPTNGITLAINNCTIDGTQSMSASGAGIYLGDFSGSAVPVQQVTIDNCTIQNNTNRGLDARGKVIATVTESSFLNNGGAASGVGGNDGFTMIAQQGATINANNNFIVHPATSTTPVTAFLTANGAGGTIIAYDNSILMNGNTTNGRGAVNGVGTITATCNWWGSVLPATNAALMTGVVSYIPWLVDGTDLGGNAADGFQPTIACAACSLVAGVTKTDVTCLNLSDGTVTANVQSGGLSPYQYQLNGGAYTTNPVFTGLAPNTYTVTVTNANGCSATASITVVVNDTEIPVITLNGSSTVNICEGQTYTDAGANASDNCALTNSIVIDNPVNTSVPGSYTITYNVTDDFGNPAAQVTRTVVVQPKPAISNTVTGNSYSQVMSSGGNYSHTICSGAELTTTIPSTSSLNPSSCGVLRIQTAYVSNLPNIPSATLDATFAQAVLAGPQVISPTNITGSAQTITFTTTPYYDVDGSNSLTGGDVLGAATTFVLTVESELTVSCPAAITVSNDPGLCSASVAFAATAIGTPTAGITYKIGANPITSPYVFPVGTTTVDVTATNSCGTVTCSFNVTVNDAEVPVITLTGNSTVSICEGLAYTDAGASAIDNCGGNLTASIVTVNPVNTSIPGSYTITYNVSDAAGNAATQITRTVVVEPKPAISNTVTGNSYSQVMSSGGNYSHTICSGAELTTTIPSTSSLNPSSCGVLRIQTAYVSTLPNIPSATLDASFAQAVLAGPQVISPTNITGSAQTITFITTPYYDVDGSNSLTVGDVSGSATTFVLTVESELTVSCPAAITVSNDPGLCSASVAFAATATGTPTAGITYKIGANPITSPYVFPVGTTTVDVTATNSCGTVTCSFNVTVNDTEVPVISLIGNSTVEICQGYTYIDDGATASDNCGGNITSSIVPNNPVNTAVPASYTVTYNVSDASGNAATTVSRTVIVKPTEFETVPPVTVPLTYTWYSTTYTLSGIYTHTIVGGALNGCDKVLTLNLTITGVKVAAKVLLDGPFNGTVMHDSLRIKGLLPLAHPYPSSALPLVNDPELATTALVLSSNNVVDWVFVGLRAEGTPNVYHATRRALLLTNGDVVDVDGVSPVTFSTATAGVNYYVEVKHRNHLGVMLATAKTLSLTPATADFTTEPLYVKPSSPALPNAPAKIVSGKQVLWTGDANSNKNIKYNGTANDKQVVLNAVGVATPNNIVGPAYRLEDVNMDGMTRYNGFNADRLNILNTVGVSTPNNVYYQHTIN
jgi:hypothetical protein